MMRAVGGIGLVVFVFVSAASALAAPPNHIWSQRFGSQYQSYGGGIAIDPSGSMFITGSFQVRVDFGGGNLVSAASDDIYLAKFDANGTHLWSRRFGGSGNEWPSAVSVDSSGNVVIAGRFDSSVDFGGGALVSAGSSDIFVAKYSSSGVHLWSRRFGDTVADHCYGLAIDGAGNVLVTGSFNGVVDFGSGYRVSSEWDVFVAKYDPNGAHLWSRTFGGPSSEAGWAIAVDHSGNVVVLGDFSDTMSFGGQYLASAGNRDVFLAKYDPNGVHLWSRRFGSTQYDTGRCVVLDASGSVFIAGGFAGAVDFGGGNLASAGEHDIFLAKYDPNGAHQWSRSFGGIWSDFPGAAAVGASGTVVLAGYFQQTANFGGGAFTSAADRDIFVAKYDASGTHLWSHGFAGPGDSCGRSDSATGVAIDATENAVVTGHFYGTVDFGGGNLVSAGCSDVFLAKYGDPPTAVVPRASTSLAQNYPNPFNPRTTIEYVVNDRAPVSIEIFDATGARVRVLDEGVREAGSHRTEWDGRDGDGRAVASGVYFYRLAGTGGTQAKKMVLIK